MVLIFSNHPKSQDLLTDLTLSVPELSQIQIVTE